jgi:predicted RNA-binding protein with PUA domain
MSNNMLTIGEQQHKDEIITLTEQVLDAKGIECDSKISEEQLSEILEGVRRLWKRKKKKIKQDNEERQKEELNIAMQ